MKPLLLLALLTLWPCAAFSQSGPAPTLKHPAPRAPLCFTWPEAQRLRDSLGALAPARREARAWHYAARNFEQAAVAAVRADSLHQAEGAGYKASLVQERMLLVDAQHQRDKFRARAHRKGWLLAALLAAATAFVFTR